MKIDLDTNELRLVAAILLGGLALPYMYFKVQNSQIENIMLMLAIFLVGGALLSNNNKKDDKQ